MTLIYVASPYNAETTEQMMVHLTYLKRAMRVVIEMGYIPVASHAIYPLVLDETDPAQRAKGMALGIGLVRKCDAIFAFADYGVSKGMAEEIAAASEARIRVAVQHIGKNAP